MVGMVMSTKDRSTMTVCVYEIVNVCLCVMAVILPEPIRWPGFEVK